MDAFLRFDGWQTLKEAIQEILLKLWGNQFLDFSATPFNFPNKFMNST
jgi:hypothetical protein